MPVPGLEGERWANATLENHATPPDGPGRMNELVDFAGATSGFKAAGEDEIGMSMPPTTDVNAAHCPLCMSPDWRTRKELRLYGYRVCKKCYYRQANRRQLAFVLDSFCMWIVMAIASAAVYAINPPTGAAPFALSGPVEIGCAALAYILFSFRDGIAGQSPGKALFGLQVVRADTLEPIGFASSFVRNAPILAINGTAFVIGLISMMLGMVVNLVALVLLLIMAYQLNRGPRWGDGVAKTKVVRKALRYRVPFDIRGLYCTNCGYDLRGSVSSMCSECGFPITASTARSAATTTSYDKPTSS